MGSDSEWTWALSRNHSEGALYRPLIQRLSQLRNVHFLVPFNLIIIFYPRKNYLFQSISISLENTLLSDFLF